MTRYRDGKFKNFLATALLFCVGTIPAVAEPALVPLPPPGFEIDQTRSDLYRAAREFCDTYCGPLFDVQVHIRRPKDDRVDYLQRVMGVMVRSGSRACSS